MPDGARMRWFFPEREANKNALLVPRSCAARIFPDTGRHALPGLDRQPAHERALNAVRRDSLLSYTDYVPEAVSRWHRCSLALVGP